jgi:hypothetical protein
VFDKDDSLFNGEQLLLRLFGSAERYPPLSLVLGLSVSVTKNVVAILLIIAQH